MNINKFTQKSLEAVQRTEKLAYEYGNQQIDQEHLLYSLLTIDDSLILKLLTKICLLYTSENRWCFMEGRSFRRRPICGRPFPISARITGEV